MAETKFTSIKHFIENSFLKDGFFRASRFKITFLESNVNSKVKVKGQLVAENYFDWLQNNIVSVAIPSVGLTVTESQYKLSIDGRAAGGEITMTFYERADLAIRRYTHNWISSTVERQGAGVDFKRRYLDDVCVDLIVAPLDRNGNVYEDNIQDKFVKVIPTSVSGINYNISAENEAGTVNINFKYMYLENSLDPKSSASIDRLGEMKRKRDVSLG